MSASDVFDDWRYKHSHLWQDGEGKWSVDRRHRGKGEDARWWRWWRPDDLVRMALHKSWEKAYW